MLHGKHRRVFPDKEIPYFSICSHQDGTIPVCCMCFENGYLVAPATIITK